MFLLSDGHITWGEPDVAALVAHFEQHCPYPTRFHCYRTGLGEENSELFEALTRKGGGVFQCYGEADLEAAAKAHRSQCLQVKRVRFVGGPAASDILVSGRRAAVYPGGELVVAARCNGVGRTTVLVEGEFAGQKMVQEFPLEVRSGSELAPRAWAEVAVASLLALHDSNLDPLVTAYCQQFGIVSRVASFLVLENEADYKRLNLEEERGRTIGRRSGRVPRRAWTQLGKRVPAAKAFERFLNQVDQRVNLLNGPKGAHVKQMLGAADGRGFRAARAVPSAAAWSIGKTWPTTWTSARARSSQRRRVSDRSAAPRGDGRRGRRGARAVEHHRGVSQPRRCVASGRLSPARFEATGAGGAAVQSGAETAALRAAQLPRPGALPWRRAASTVWRRSITRSSWPAPGTIAFGKNSRSWRMEEYAHMMQEAIRHKHVSNKLANLFGERLEQMPRPQPQSDLRVTISWNTDATDVDLWVIEPDGTKCFYQHNRTRSGGELSQDQTQGYGPERYQIAKAQPGEYTIIVHYFRPNPNLLGGETHVSVRVTRFAGTPRESTERHTVILKKHNRASGGVQDQVLIGSIPPPRSQAELGNEENLRSDDSHRLPCYHNGQPRSSQIAADCLREPLPSFEVGTGSVMAEPSSSKPDVTIVGAGLAGTLLACYLARAGRRVDLYEKRADPRRREPEQGRSINLALSLRGIDALREIGLADEVLKASILMRGRMIHSPTGELTFQPYGKDDAEALHSVSRAGLNLASDRGRRSSSRRFG